MLLRGGIGGEGNKDWDTFTVVEQKKVCQREMCQLSAWCRGPILTVIQIVTMEPVMRILAQTSARETSADTWSIGGEQVLPPAHKFENGRVNKERDPQNSSNRVIVGENVECPSTTTLRAGGDGAGRSPAGMRTDHA
jgi:hypothetical protein